jgi:uncharacterized protein (UPF0548 family)
VLLRFRRPSNVQLAALAIAASTDPFTYTEVGATSRGERPAGYLHDAVSAVIGDAAHFDEAVERLRSWQAHRGSGIELAATGDLVPGTTVALAAPVLGVWVVATCRVVYVEEDVDRFAWAYGTLPEHPEQGEERFELRREDGATVFAIDAFSRPRHWLVRAVSPVARRQQVRATANYLRAMSGAG